MTTEDQGLSRRDFARAAEFLSGGYAISRIGVADAAGDLPLFRGQIGTRQLPGGLRLCTSDITALRDSLHEALVPRSLFIALAIDGVPGDYELDSGEAMPLPPGSALMICTRDGARLLGRYNSDQYFRSLLVQADPSVLKDEELAAKVDKLITCTTSAALGFNQRAHSLACQLSRPPLGGPVGSLLIESCALELLAYGLLQAESDANPSSAAPVSRRDRERVARVRDILTTAPDRPHHLSDLAREAGMSVSSLKTKFPAIVGQPVFEFLRDLRLERARQGLEQEGWTVSQAAYFVGYRHASNFSTAFRRRFQVSPRDIRRA